MVAIAQSVEHLIVVQEVARSSRVSHPTSTLCLCLKSRGFIICNQTSPASKYVTVCDPKLANDFTHQKDER